MSEIEPGWYKDPAEPTTQRYWDGEGWIGAPLPADASPPAGP
ncbi:MAG: transporter, partial [Dactylosporangium sp.]|nr:transporter [Dactylosporangium sp.]